MFVQRRALLLAVALLAYVCSGCLYGRIAYYGPPTLSAALYFDERVVHARPDAAPLPRAAREHYPLTAAEREAYRSFDDMLESNETRAFVVVRSGRVVYERYFGGLTAKTRLPAFSVSKSWAALLVGCAIADGLLGDVRDRLVKYVPEVRGRPGYGAITIEHLLRMTSGIDFDEESIAGAILYYSEHLPEHTYAYDVAWRPGSRYLYGSVSIQILGDVLQRRLGGRTIASYFEERVWRPLGAERDAAWSLDSRTSGVEKFADGFSATARDYARLGLLFLGRGRVDGEQLVPEAWVLESISPDPVYGVTKTVDGWVRHGKYQWFLSHDRRAFFAKGYHGQYIFVVPSAELVVVRFGEAYGDVDWPALFFRIAAAG